jgi:hypothetical protein
LINHENNPTPLTAFRKNEKTESEEGKKKSDSKPISINENPDDEKFLIEYRDRKIIGIGKL